MIKNIKTYFLIVCLGFFIQIVFVNKAYAVPVGGILKSFKGIGKIFKKSKDMKKKILITGSEGFIGKSFYNHFSFNNFTVL